MNDRNTAIDFLKMTAIIAVILLHSMTIGMRNMIGGPYHILQAVPLFIMISGYNSMNSVTRQSLDYKQQYRFDLLSKKFQRLLQPFTLIFIVEMALLQLVGQLRISGVPLAYIKGGFGPGSYYVPLMIQLTLLVPILIEFVRRFPKGTLFIVTVCSLGLEFFFWKIHLQNEIYRQLLIRYILPLTLGVYAALYREKIRYIWILLAGCSLVYISGVEYLYWTSFAQVDWRSQNTLAFFYPFALFLLVIERMRFREGLFSRLTVLVGKSSYHIYLIQMLYFWTGLPIRIGLVQDSLKGAVFSVVICVLLGILFYKLDNRILKWRIRRV